MKLTCMRALMCFEMGAFRVHLGASCKTETKLTQRFASCHHLYDTYSKLREYITRR